ncbi:MAG: 2-(5-triphosphoribosyl)-3-dephosphocoenzyme-A synthase [Pelosinus sp.]|jgi:holo-ACP synthase/triphosphoribosyl-dephospho-CoA synthase|nr:2-(5-triphosphoribosyl)-3-dephosphocoenzyme-A synthase [Pelosinus sp.]
MTKELTLEDVLAAKEARATRQQEFKEKHKAVVVSITINMPGALKDTPILRRLRDYAVQEVKKQFAVLAEEHVNVLTGPEALLAIDNEGWLVKQAAMKIEETHSFSRLLDIDVFDRTGILLSRRDEGKGRGCFVCGGEFILCRRKGLHSQEDLLGVVRKLLNGFKAHESRFISPAAEKIGALAIEAMLYEVTCTPSPGLVDRVNSGAHQDMDFYSFMASSAALSGSMNRCAQAGILHEGDVEELLPVLRIIGLEGEQAMLAATKGVNTQKGLIFLLGIMAGIAGWLQRRSLPVTAEAVLRNASLMVAGIVERELAGAVHKSLEQLTAGERLYITYGITGIRGELAAGLPAVKDKALPALREALGKGSSVNDALIYTLLVLMTCVDDTTVMHRHHPDKMRVWVREQAQMVIQAGGMETDEGRKKCEDLDKEFILQNVSPGGVADLLAVTWFLHCL